MKSRIKKRRVTESPYTASKSNSTLKDFKKENLKKFPVCSVLNTT